MVSEHADKNLLQMRRFKMVTVASTRYLGVSIQAHLAPPLGNLAECITLVCMAGSILLFKRGQNSTYLFLSSSSSSLLCICFSVSVSLLATPFLSLFSYETALHSLSPLLSPFPSPIPFPFPNKTSLLSFVCMGCLSLTCSGLDPAPKV